MLFLHAGTVKTGTTYLQKTFYENRDLFREYGITYLPVDEFNLSLPRYANAKFLYEADPSDDIRTLIKSAAISDLLVSEEGIFGNVEHLRNPIFQGLPKKIIIYLRPTAELLCAWAAEFCQPYNVVTFPNDASFHPTGRKILPFDIALEVASHEHAISVGRFMNIVDEVGTENILIRPYERASFVEGNLLADFLTCLGLDTADIFADPKFCDPSSTNISQNRKFCDISRAVWLRLGRPIDLIDFNFDLVSSITENCASGDSRPAIETITDNQIDWFTGRFAHFDEYISKTFLNGAPLFKNKYPSCYGIDRPLYAPIEETELARLFKRNR